MLTLALLLSATALAGPLEGGPQSVSPLPLPPPPCPEYDLRKAVQLSPDAACWRRALGHTDVNETDRNGNTPLHLAILAHNRAGILFLLKSGADLNARNLNHQSPRELCESLGFTRLADYFADLESETERLGQAVEDGEINAAREALRRGAAIGTRDIRQDTFLHRAAQSGLDSMIRLLVQHGAPVNARNYLGETPLHAAALRDHASSMRLLIKLGANPKALNFRRETIADISGGRQDPKAEELVRKNKVPRGSPASVDFDFGGSDGQGSAALSGAAQ